MCVKYVRCTSPCPAIMLPVRKSRTTQFAFWQHVATWAAFDNPNTRHKFCYICCVLLASASSTSAQRNTAVKQHAQTSLNGPPRPLQFSRGFLEPVVQSSRGDAESARPENLGNARHWYLSVNNSATDQRLSLAVPGCAQTNNICRPC